MRYTAYTDGSSYWKTGEGGFGCYIKYYPNQEHIISEGFSNTKTGRMEIMALLNVLEFVSNECELIVYSDSQYVVNSINEGWLFNWYENDFNNCKKNSDLWRKIIDVLLNKDIDLTIYHIKGHQKIVDVHTEGNNVADELADYKQFSDRNKDLPDYIWEKVKSNKTK